jgi:hypothetical protein
MKEKWNILPEAPRIGEDITIMPDVIFSSKETEYLVSQRLARIATASSSSSEGFI